MAAQRHKTVRISPQPRRGWGLAAGAVAELVDGGVGAAAAGVGGAFAGFGCVDAFATVIDHALDDGLAKAHDVVVVDGGAGCEQAVAKVHMRPAKQLDGKGDNGGLVDHDVIEQPGQGRGNLCSGNLVDIAQRDGDTGDDLGVDAGGTRGDDLSGARRQNLVVIEQIAQDDGLVDDGATHGCLLPRDPKSYRRSLLPDIQSKRCVPRTGDWGPRKP